jgi:hypothetical protein
MSGEKTFKLKGASSRRVAFGQDDEQGSSNLTDGTFAVSLLSGRESEGKYAWKSLNRTPYRGEF